VAPEYAGVFPRQQPIIIWASNASAHPLEEAGGSELSGREDPGKDEPERVVAEPPAAESDTTEPNAVAGTAAEPHAVSGAVAESETGVAAPHVAAAPAPGGGSVVFEGACTPRAQLGPCRVRGALLFSFIHWE